MTLRDERLEILQLDLPIYGSHLSSIVVLCTSRDDNCTNVIVADIDGALHRESILGDVMKKPEIYKGVSLGTTLDLLNQHQELFDVLVAAGAIKHGPLTTIRSMLMLRQDPSLDPVQVLDSAARLSHDVAAGIARYNDHARQIVKLS